MSDAAKQAFAKVASEYAWEDTVRDFMLHPEGLNAQSIADFTFLAEPDIERIVDNAKEVKNKMQQRSRLRQAWSGLKKAQSDQDAIKRKRADDVDLDELLPAEEMNGVLDVFHARYKIRWPTPVMPSDALVSRVVKEVTKRVITLRDVWKSRTQAHQQRACHKRTKIAEGLDLVHEEDEDVTDDTRTVQRYLDALWVLFLAYGVAGATKLTSATKEAPETRTSDPLLYVELPLETLIKVYNRASIQVRKVRPNLQLSWLETRMDGERESWIDGYRYSQRSLGQVIQTTFENREAVWNVEESMAKGGNAPPPKAGSHQGSPLKPAKQSSDPPTPSQRKGQAARVADKLRDNTALCREYNNGNKCKNGSSCQRGKHVCGGLLNNGRVCGGRHPASACVNKKVKKKA